MIKNIFLVLPLLSTCTTKSTIYVPDPAKILSYSPVLEDQKHLPRPYVAKFGQNGKILFYLAAAHVSVTKSTKFLEHPTIRTIQAAFNDFQPDVTVVEGIHTGAELSPKSILKAADECDASVYKVNCGESIFAINMARSAAGQFISGEPDDFEIKEAILKEGFSELDLLGFYTVRLIPHIKRQSTGKDLDLELESIISQRKKTLAIENPFGLNDFKLWYSNHMPNSKKYSELDANDTGPRGGKDATFIQAISYKIDKIRDRTIVQRIADMLNKFNKVLVVYGGSHLLSEEPALIEMLGEPTYFDLSSWPKR